MNRLGGEASPYLRGHARDPVDWYPWGEEAFDRARREGRPVFVSVGFATCHWCHVMHEESFSDPEVARVLNGSFVCVKVDREERPDLDQYFMDVCVALTGSGGWPLSLFLTPEGHPFFAATYIPRWGRPGRPGILEVLGAVARYWEEHRDEAVENSREIHGYISRARDYAPGGSLPVDAAERLYAHLASIHDPEGGGFGPPPLFPMPQVHLFLLRYASVSGRAEPLDLSCRVLAAMARGGVYDQLGGGFHRYSTDGRWLVPHFEKVLCDQALAALAYAEAFSLTGDRTFSRVARECMDYMCRDLQSPGGGFYAGEDADSAGGEGAFYTWTWEEIDAILDPGEREVFSRIFLVGGRERGGTKAGSAVAGPEIPGVLSAFREPREAAQILGMDEESVGAVLSGARAKLLSARNSRPRPPTDTLVLADWNGLAISALAVGSRVFGEPAFLQAAARAAGFVLRSMRSPDGGLFHRWSAGDAAVEGMSADYAGMVMGLVDLFLATGKPSFLSAAIELEKFHEEEFWDPARGGYYVTRASVRDVPARRKEFLDGTVPSSNALSVSNLARLSLLTGNDAYLGRVEAITRYYPSLAASYPGSCAMFFAGRLLVDGRSGTVVLAGGGGGPTSSRLEEVVDRNYSPFLLPVRMGNEANAAGIAGLLPWCRPFLGEPGPARAHVCTGNVCLKPVEDAGELEALLGGFRSSLFIPPGHGRRED